MSQKEPPHTCGMWAPSKPSPKNRVPFAYTPTPRFLSAPPLEVNNLRFNTEKQKNIWQKVIQSEPPLAKCTKVQQPRKLPRLCKIGSGKMYQFSRWLGVVDFLCARPFNRFADWAPPAPKTPSMGFGAPALVDLNGLLERFATSSPASNPASPKPDAYLFRPAAHLKRKNKRQQKLEFQRRLGCNIPCLSGFFEGPGNFLLVQKGK